MEDDFMKPEIKPVESNVVEKTRLFFSEDTPLKKAEQFGGRVYERRVEQDTMAGDIAQALKTHRNLCVEAPTGIGKSFAYLIPAIYHACSTRTPVLVTTETITLQEQLVKKDLPLLKKLTGMDFSFVLAKGRSNYLCKRRFSLTFGEHRDEMLGIPLQRTVQEQIQDWANTTDTGSKSDINFSVPPQLWASICCETSNCAGKKCSFYHDCFYWRVRHQWDKADIIVTNHALFFIDLKIREIEKQDDCPLPKYKAVIFDEAHTLEDNASAHLGLHINSSAVKFFLNRLFNPRTQNGLLMRQGVGAGAITLRGAVNTLHDAMSVFFSQYDTRLARTKDNCMRIPEGVEYEDNFTPQLRKLRDILDNYKDSDEAADFKLEISSNMQKCEAFQEEIEEFVQMRGKNQVYWAEGHGDEMSQQHSIDLISAPLDVADQLRLILFTRDIPVILTSATLAVNNSLDFYAHRVGFCNGAGLILGSPFNYPEQMRLYVSRTMPQPSDPNFNSALAERIFHFVTMTQGHAFVLFTSMATLKFCARALSAKFKLKGIKMLVQGEDMSRSAMLNEFKKNGKAVLFGADSFWTGIDVPGDALTNVIITKLPFAVPDHPLVEAKCEIIEGNGGKPFFEYSIPDAVLQFRQGIGRLIRSKTDRGIVVILDPRVVTKGYGRSFMNAVPPCPVEYF